MVFETARFLVPGSASQFRESDAKVLALDNGQFDISFFQDRTPSVSYDTDVRITRLNADGSSATGGNSIAIKAPVDRAESDGSLATLGTLQAVAFTERTAPGADGQIRLNFYNKDALNTVGGFYGQSVLVDGTPGNKYRPEVTALENGNLAVVYVDGASHAIKARIYDPALGGFTSASFTISTTPTDQKLSLAAPYGLTSLSDGSFAVSWFDNAQVSHLRVVGENGKFATGDITVATGAGPGTVTELGDGSLAVSYTRGGGAYFQTFYPDGTNASGPVRVSDAALNVITTALDDGRLLVGYTATQKSVFAQIYNADGTADGGAIEITQYSPQPKNFTSLESLATLADGRVVATYGKLLDGDVYAVILDPREEGVRLAGTAQADQFVGTGFDDVFHMGKGNDNVQAGAGNDTIDGGKGADTMVGGAGNDIFYVDNKGDKVVEAAGGGVNTVRSSISYTLGDNVENLTLTGKANLLAFGNTLANVLTGNSGDNIFYGNGGGDTLIGGAGDDLFQGVTSADRIVEKAGGGTDRVITSDLHYALTAGAAVESITSIYGKFQGGSLTGNEFGQTIGGGTGADVFDGKGGADVFIGGYGNDTFKFSTALGAGNVDRIADFANEAGNDDRISLDHSVFAGLAAGALATGAFAANADGVAKDADDRIVYETDTGKLFYDKDGAGGAAAVQFAVIDNHATLTAADFFVV